VWQIDIKEQINGSELEDVASRLLNTLHEYKDEIKKIDFKVDIEKLKKDIKSSSKDIF
jgi:hypothetical protein